MFTPQVYNTHNALQSWVVRKCQSPAFLIEAYAFPWMASWGQCYSRNNHVNRLETRELFYPPVIPHAPFYVTHSFNDVSVTCHPRGFFSQRPTSGPNGSETHTGVLNKSVRTLPHRVKHLQGLTQVQLSTMNHDLDDWEPSSGLKLCIIRGVESLSDSCLVSFTSDCGCVCSFCAFFVGYRTHYLSFL